MLDDIGPQILADGARLPMGRAQQPVHPIRAALPDQFGDLPAVAPLNRTEQSRQIPPDALTRLSTPKARGNPHAECRQLRLPGRDLVQLSRRVCLLHRHPRSRPHQLQGFQTAVVV